MGPYAMADLAGLDVGWRIRQHGGQTAPVSDALFAKGRFGQKTGAGYYLYMNGARLPVPDPRVTALAEKAAAELGIARREISEPEILERMTYPLINEAARILEAGIATRASDIDVIWTHGFGWPAWRGGPCFYADQIGAQKICDALNQYAARSGDPLLAPAPLLRALGAKGGRFAELKPNA
jgi:3-hydroxyacyl-CoA dehydrogenase